MIHRDVIGCDIAKSHLDIFDSRVQRHDRIDNSPAAIDVWLASLDGQEVHVVFEATGRYDRALRLSLAARQRSYSRVNPARARDFAKAIGLLAKTDAIDARLLARMGQSLPLSSPLPEDPVRQALPISTPAATSSLPCGSRKGPGGMKPKGRSATVWNGTWPFWMPRSPRSKRHAGMG